MNTNEARSHVYDVVDTFFLETAPGIGIAMACMIYNDIFSRQDKEMAFVLAADETFIECVWAIGDYITDKNADALYKLDHITPDDEFVIDDSYGYHAYVDTIVSARLSESFGHSFYRLKHMLKRFPGYKVVDPNQALKATADAICKEVVEKSASDDVHTVSQFMAMAALKFSQMSDDILGNNAAAEVFELNKAALEDLGALEGYEPIGFVLMQIGDHIAEYAESNI